VPDDLDRKRDVYVRDLVAGTTVLVSRGANGKSNGSAFGPTISADGRKVAFESSATNLDPADTDTAWDVYVRDVTAGTTQLVSRASGPDGTKAGGAERLSSAGSYISEDGRSIVFDSNATNLDRDDRDDNDDVYVRDLGAP
jgi:Tol biopolymer transport system component